MIDDPLKRLKAKRGSDLPWSKLTEVDVENIRRLSELKKRLIDRLNQKYSAKALANRYGVHHRTIEKVIQCNSWTHI